MMKQVKQRGNAQDQEGFPEPALKGARETWLIC
jgi:hypothetical protein